MRWLLLFLGVMVLLVGSYFFGREQMLLQQQTTTVTPKTTPQPTTPQVNAPAIVVTYTPTATSANTNSNTLPSAGGGPQNDIIEIQQITASQQVAQVGDDINYTVTIKNQAPYKKFIQAICFNSSESNFGCASGKNLAPGEIFNINNTGRFHAAGTKSVWITWTQDGFSYYRPVNGGTAQVTIQ